MNKELFPDWAFNEVEKVECNDLIPGYNFNSKLTHAIIVKTGKNKKRVVNFCSENYTLLTNEEILTAFVNTLDKAFTYEIAGKQKNQSRFHFDFVIKDEEFKIEKDIIVPKIKLINSYDGKLKLSVAFGYYRIVCKNGMSVPVANSETQSKIMHTPAMFNKDAIGKIITSFEKFIGKGKELSKPFKILATHKLNDAQIEARVKAVIEHTKFPKRRIEDVMARVLKESTELQIPKSDWLIYNALNYQLNHNQEIKMEFHKKDKVDQEVLKYLLNK